MADMLVKLYDLPPLHPLLERLGEQSIEIRLAHPIEQDIVTAWVRHHFSNRWALECEAAFRQQPVKCFVAVEVGNKPEGGGPYDLSPELLVGFACYDVVALNLFGPTGVREDYRGRGIGTALLLASLYAWRRAGYAYGIIAWAGPTTFYERIVGATEIDGSEPGIYRGPLIRSEDTTE